MASAADESFTSQVLRGVSKDNNQQLLSKVSQVEPQQVREAMSKYLVPLFQPKTANLVVICAQIMAETAVANFKGAGFEPKAKPLEYFQDDYGFAAPEGEDEADEEDEDFSDEEGDEEVEDESSEGEGA